MQLQVYPLLSVEVATPENNKLVLSTLSSICVKIRLKSASYKDADHPSSDSPNPSRRSALGTRNICLVDENPTCSIPAL